MHDLSMLYLTKDVRKKVINDDTCSILYMCIYIYTSIFMLCMYMHTYASIRCQLDNSTVMCDKSGFRFFHRGDFSSVGVQLVVLLLPCCRYCPSLRNTMIA